LAAKGGYAINAPKEYLGYALWSEHTLQYYPDYKEEFKVLLGENLDTYISNTPKSEKKQTRISFRTNIPESIDYNLFIFNNQVVGITVEDISTGFSISPLGKDGATIGLHSEKPSFTVRTDYNIDEFKELQQQSVQILETCKDKNNTVLMRCINQNKDQRWQIGSCEGDNTNADRTFRFCVKSDFKSLIHNTDKDEFGYFPITYKFALKFPQPTLKT